jgi:hypothetical protein
MIQRRTFIHEKNYLVQISIEGKGEVTHYYHTREAAEIFFMLYCVDMDVKYDALLPNISWARAKRDGLTVDFEKIATLTLSSIFNLS